MLYHLMGPGLCGSVAINELKEESLYTEHQSCRKVDDHVCQCMQFVLMH